MTLGKQIGNSAAVAVVLGCLFGLGDLGRVMAAHPEYVRDAVAIARWLLRCAALGAVFALVVTLPATLLFLRLRPGDGSPEHTRRVAAGVWILAHVFLVLLWQDYKSLERELETARMLAKAGFLAVAVLAAWVLSRPVSRIASGIGRAAWGRAGAVVLAVLRIGFGGARWFHQRDLPSRPEARGPNVLFILVDTLRADALGAYGYQRPTSPHIDALAERGFLFREAIAESSWTIPTVASIFTGTYPDVHRVTNYEAVLSGDFLTLAEAFHAAGYRTGARISNIFVNGEHGYLQGFDDGYIVMDLYRLLFLEKLLAQARITRHYDFSTGDEITDAGIQWLDRNGGKPFYLYLHYYDPHFPYYPPPDYAMRYVEPEMARRYPYHSFAGDALWNIVSEYKIGTARSPEAIAYNRAVYDAEINFVDDQIGRLLAHLKDAGLADNTIVVFTADHGEQFYEHGQRLHSKTLYNEEVGVPLIVSAPGVAAGESGRRVRALDIYSTLMELADVPGRFPEPALARKMESQVMGASLVPLMRGEDLTAPGADRIFCSLDIDGVKKEAFFEGDWKYIRNIAPGDDIPRPPEELYQLAVDPAEREDLAVAHAAERQRMAVENTASRKSMAARAVSEVESRPLSKGDEEKLRALGYVND